jgi:glutamate-1-semialdehyde 2,1-aminomutase
VAQIVGEPSVFDIVFTDRPVVDYRAVLTNDTARLRRFNEVCLRGGVLKGGSKIYVSTVHDERDVERTLAVFENALEAVGRL